MKVWGNSPNVQFQCWKDAVRWFRCYLWTVCCVLTKHFRECRRNYILPSWLLTICYTTGFKFILNFQTAEKKKRLQHALTVLLQKCTFVLQTNTYNTHSTSHWSIPISVEFYFLGWEFRGFLSLLLILQVGNKIVLQTVITIITEQECAKCLSSGTMTHVPMPVAMAN